MAIGPTPGRARPLAMPLPRRHYLLWKRECLVVPRVLPASPAVLLDVELSGDGSVDARGMIGQSAIVEGEGSGEVIVSVEGHRLAVVIDGSMDVTATGAVDIALVSIGGSGEFFGRELTATAVEVEISGSGAVAVSAEDRLDAVVSGSGDVVYWEGRRCPRMSVDRGPWNAAERPGE